MSEIPTCLKSLLVWNPYLSGILTCFEIFTCLKSLLLWNPNFFEIQTKVSRFHTFKKVWNPNKKFLDFWCILTKTVSEIGIKSLDFWHILTQNVSENWTFCGNQTILGCLLSIIQVLKDKFEQEFSKGVGPKRFQKSDLYSGETKTP